MMFLFALALAAAAPSDPAHPSWMVGTWAWQNPGETGVDCGSDHDFTYNRDGTYDFIDTTGTWRIEGNSLVETQTNPGESGDPADNGKPHIIRFKRIGSRVLQVVGENPGKLIKCPAS